MVIRVSDTGIGIAKHELERVFEPFVQLDSSLARKYEGTGLGLALSRRWIEFHGGTLVLDSDLGVGTVAVIRLPWEQGPFHCHGRAIAKARPRQAIDTGGLMTSPQSLDLPVASSYRTELAEPATRLSADCRRVARGLPDGLYPADGNIDNTGANQIRAGDAANETARARGSASPGGSEGACRSRLLSRAARRNHRPQDAPGGVRLSIRCRPHARRHRNARSDRPARRAFGACGASRGPFRARSGSTKPAMSTSIPMAASKRSSRPIGSLWRGRTAGVRAGRRPSISRWRRARRTASRCSSRCPGR